MKDRTKKEIIEQGLKDLEGVELTNDALNTICWLMQCDVNEMYNYMEGTNSELRKQMLDAKAETFQVERRDELEKQIRTTTNTVRAEHDKIALAIAQHLSARGCPHELKPIKRWDNLKWDSKNGIVLKQCNICGEWLPLEFFAVEANTNTRLKGRCKQCHNRIIKENKRK